MADRHCSNESEIIGRISEKVRWSLSVIVIALLLFAAAFGIVLLGLAATPPALLLLWSYLSVPAPRAA